MPDQEIDDILGNGNKPQDQSSDEKESPDKEIISEEDKPTVKGMQKAYTQYRQEAAQYKQEVASLKEQIAKLQTSGPQEGDDEYITVKGLKQILAETLKNQSEFQHNEESEIDKTIEFAITDLYAEGILKTEADRDDLLTYATEIEETDLYKAAKGWVKLQEAKTNKSQIDSKDKAKERQKSASIVGDSTKTGSESKGVDYKQVKKMTWW